mmetsp:Transcript_27679/g.89069  ORF Transcript_27679/g.89069 Transcript_27679/m.89069 type:complete len:528 (+) Transcript_27679:382-1965(+)
MTVHCRSLHGRGPFLHHRRPRCKVRLGTVQPLRARQRHVQRRRLRISAVANPPAPAPAPAAAPAPAPAQAFAGTLTGSCMSLCRCSSSSSSWRIRRPPRQHSAREPPVLAAAAAVLGRCTAREVLRPVAQPKRRASHEGRCCGTRRPDRWPRLARAMACVRAAAAARCSRATPCGSWSLHAPASFLRAAGGTSSGKLLPHGVRACSAAGFSRATSNLRPLAMNSGPMVSGVEVKWAIHRAGRAPAAGLLHVRGSHTKRTLTRQRHLGMPGGTGMRMKRRLRLVACRGSDTHTSCHLHERKSATAISGPPSTSRSCCSTTATPSERSEQSDGESRPSSATSASSPEMTGGCLSPSPPTSSPNSSTLGSPAPPSYRTRCTLLVEKQGVQPMRKLCGREDSCSPEEPTAATLMSPLNVRLPCATSVLSWAGRQGFPMGSSAIHWTIMSKVGVQVKAAVVTASTPLTVPMRRVMVPTRVSGPASDLRFTISTNDTAMSGARSGEQLLSRIIMDMGSPILCSPFTDCSCTSH